MIASVAKRCSACEVEKSADDFFGPDAKGYLSAACKPCTTERQRVWRDENRERYRENARRYAQARREDINARRRSQYKSDPAQWRKNRLRYVYGITVEQYNEMLERQGGLCAVCREEETRTMKGTVKALAVDHDHETGAVRGLLCHDCNTGLGMFGDDPGRLLAATDYLIRQED